MELTRVESIAQLLVEALRPNCARIEIAGSIRRRKADVKDIEIVYISKVGQAQIGTLFPIEGSLMETGIAYLVACRVLAWDTRVKRAGPKYQRLVHLVSGMVVELFAATPENWGYILTLRTGPAEFNKMLVSPPWKGGVKPLDIAFKDGTVYRNGAPLVVPEEHDLFIALRLPLIAPERRSPETLHALTGWREKL